MWYLIAADLVLVVHLLFIGLPGGFISHYLIQVIYPPGLGPAGHPLTGPPRWTPGRPPGLSPLGSSRASS
jgi:hypothetical protein